jgi:hypothetical protein
MRARKSDHARRKAVFTYSVKKKKQEKERKPIRVPIENAKGCKTVNGLCSLAARSSTLSWLLNLSSLSRPHETYSHFLESF